MYTHHKPINKFEKRHVVSQRRKVESNAQIKTLPSTLQLIDYQLIKLMR